MEPTKFTGSTIHIYGKTGSWMRPVQERFGHSFTFPYDSNQDSIFAQNPDFNWRYSQWKPLIFMEMIRIMLFMEKISYDERIRSLKFDQLYLEGTYRAPIRHPFRTGGWTHLILAVNINQSYEKIVSLILESRENWDFEYRRSKNK